MRLQILQRGWFTILFLAGILSIVTAMILIEASSAFAAQRGIVMSSGLARGGSDESIELRAHSIRPGHVFPTRTNGVS